MRTHFAIFGASLCLLATCTIGPPTAGKRFDSDAPVVRSDRVLQPATALPAEPESLAELNASPPPAQTAIDPLNNNQARLADQLIDAIDAYDDSLEENHLVEAVRLRLQLRSLRDAAAIFAISARSGGPFLKPGATLRTLANNVSSRYKIVENYYELLVARDYHFESALFAQVRKAMTELELSTNQIAQHGKTQALNRTE